MDRPKKFISSITALQLEKFIETVFTYTDIDTLETIFSKLDGDIKDCYDKFYGITDGIEYSEEELAQMKSDDKFQEEFSSLIGDIDDAIMDLGDEDGKYVSQGHHWESPEFDPWEFSSDLEEIFEKMLPMLDRAYDLGLEESSLFTNFLDEIDSGIGMYPEWMGAEYSEFEIESKGAECILKWCWLNRDSVRSFLAEAEEIFKKYSINNKFEPAFLQNEQAGVMKELYKELSELRKNPEWQNKFDNVNSFWQSIYLNAESAADKKSFLMTSQKMISQKWHCGIAVYENYMDNKDFEKAEEYCRETIGEFFRQNIHGNFSKNIKTSVYALHSEIKDTRIDKAFKDWLVLCEELGLEECAGAVEMQYAFYLYPCNFEKLKFFFNSYRYLPFYENYLKEWKNFIIMKTINRHYSNADGECWLGYIIDFLLDEEKEIFISKTKKWLAEPLKVSDFYNHGNQFQLLLKLSQNTLANSDLINQFPIFKQYLFNADYSSYDYEPNKKDKTLKKEILSLLEKADAEKLEKEVINAWKSNVHKLIPSPANAHKSDYSSHAKWLAVAKELNQEVFQRFYNNWKREHSRKINLWSSLSCYGIKKPK